MKGEKIFDAITGVKDEYIEEARKSKLEKSDIKWKTWLGLAASLVLVVGLGGSLLRWKLPFGGSSGSPGGEGSGNPGGGGSGHDGSTVFMSYAGPVFPLKLGEEDKDVEADRNISYDFSLASEDSLRIWGSHVEDSYRLENTSSEDKILKIRYPFAASFAELGRYTPTISINKQEVETSLYGGGYTGGFYGAGGIDDEEGSHNLLALDSWEGYKSLLESGSYEENAFMPYPELNKKVIVYRFTDFQAPEEYEAATQAISFVIDQEKTLVLTYGFNGGDYSEDGFRRFSYFVPNKVRRESNDKYLIVVGDDIGDYDLQGYKDGGCDRGNELEGVSTRIIREEMILSEAMEEIVGNFLDLFGDGEYEGDNKAIIPREMLLGSVSDFMLKYSLISPAKTDRYDFGMLEDVISDAKSIKRVFYLEFEAVIPANEKIQVLASMHKNPSYDFHCSNSKNQGIQSYDMVTRLGSNLSFRNLTAEITSTEEIEIVNQNFGFNLEEGLTRVHLDLDIEHYYLEIKTNK